MTLFVIVFLTLYAAMHSYLFWKVHAAFPHMGWGHWVLAAVMLVLVLSPVITVLLDRSRFPRASSIAGAVAYPWMAMIFWFFVLCLLGDAWNVLVRLVGLAAPPVRAAAIGPRLMLAAMVVIVAAASVYSFIEAGRIRIHRVTIPVTNLPPGLQQLKVVQISDVHLGLHLLPERFDRVLALIKEADGDIVVSTGDLVDSSFHNIRHYAAPLAEIRPRLGKFAVFGNHEFYAGPKNSLEFHKEAGFTVLAGESVLLDNGVRIAGVDDPAGGRDGNPRTDESLALPAQRDAAVTVLLKHQPVVFPPSTQRMDLQLSGHTHGGQIFPFHLITRSVYPLFCGLHEVGGASLYASNGTGTWGPPMRLFAPPEVTLITFVRK